MSRAEWYQVAQWGEVDEPYHVGWPEAVIKYGRRMWRGDVNTRCLYTTYKGCLRSITPKYPWYPLEGIPIGVHGPHSARLGHPSRHHLDPYRPSTAASKHSRWQCRPHLGGEGRAVQHHMHHSLSVSATQSTRGIVFCPHSQARVHTPIGDVIGRIVHLVGRIPSKPVPTLIVSLVIYSLRTVPMDGTPSPSTAYVITLNLQYRRPVLLFVAGTYCHVIEEIA